MVKTVSTAVFSQFSQLASAIMDFFKIEFESKEESRYILHMPNILF